MPLLRITSHYVDNREMVDKMIFIDGLPSELLLLNHIYKEIDKENLTKEQIELVNRLQPNERVKLGPWDLDVLDNIPKDILDKFGPGIRIDYQTGQGEFIWNAIERVLELETPRDKFVPKPVPVGNRMNWLLKAEDIPVVTLKKTESVDVEEIKKSDEPLGYVCIECGIKFISRHGLKIHVARMNHKKNLDLVGAKT